MISVVIPTFNRAKKVRRAIESVKNQTFKADEIIVVDDGSTDETLKILEKIKDIKVIYQQNLGVSEARNRGIKEAKGEWIAFLDSDDWWFEDKLLKQIKFHKENPDILISQTDEIWIKNGIQINKAKRFRKKLQGYIFKPSLNMCHISPSAVMIHRKVFEDVGVFDPSLPACEDYDLWLRISKKYFIGLIDEPLIAKTGGHEDQLSMKYWGMDRFRIKAMLKHINDPKVKDLVKKEIEKKCKILINGAKKRGNIEIEKEYSNLLKQITNQNFYL